MVHDGNKVSCADDSFLKPGTSDQNLSLSRSLAFQRSEAGKNIAEMEGRGYSHDFYRNTSEEMFIKTLMDGSVGMPAPTMEMLGFKNLSQNFRTDSEELFKSWLTTGETQGYNSASISNRTQQASRRMSTELSNLSNQHNGVHHKRSNANPKPHTTVTAEEFSNDMNQQSVRNGAERGDPASNLFLAKAWFHSSQPMTRSRSSELRKRYAAIQNTQTAFGIEAMHNASGNGVNNTKQDFVNPNEFVDASMCEIPNQFTSFMSPSNSSSSNFNTPQIGTVDNVSSVVTLLKGTLERKKLTNHIEKESVEDCSLGYYCAQEVVGNPSVSQGQDYHIYEQGTFQNASMLPLNHGPLQTIQGSVHMDFEEYVAPTNPIQMSIVSREPSQSESSAAAPVVSAGFDACEGPSNSGQTQSNCTTSRQQVGKGKCSENGSIAKDIRERIYDNLKEDRQPKRSLVRHGSVTSVGSVDRGDPTKKRRVERSRKMAEAKERVLTPAISSDMQSILKRCENLEKEVRSLKLNLAFMNRKDSEQTKQIEELQKQNEDLVDEKERLVEEIERIISETGKM